jgi:hypothetical protein
VISGDLAGLNVSKPKAQDFTGTQRVPGRTTSVSLSIVAAWDDESSDDASKTRSLAEREAASRSTRSRRPATASR